ncbi:3D domain-containing protein [Lysinibacillus sp. NPDC093712]|uniref:3D domain-containing protein n=1 Tax=Lysinibacillus sp. NPDC093712 TaxID=3390579 RepID=UPI003D04C740
MKRLKKSLTVPTIIICTLGWSWFTIQVINDNRGVSIESEDVIKSMDNLNNYSIAYQVNESINFIHTESERLKEEERKRLEELERQRLRLEQIRLAKIEEANKLTEQKRLEEQKRKQQVVSRGDTGITGDWISFNASYYTAFCSEGCTGITATGYDVSNTIYYNGLRIIATDPRIIKLGTIVEVKTPYETFKAISLDTGGAIKSNKIDVLVSSTEEAYRLGRHNVKIRILKTHNK